MKNNWPETIDELIEECQRLISRCDLYTLGERGEPLTGGAEPRVDGTEYLAGEYRYGVAMIPAQWVTHVVEVVMLTAGEAIDWALETLGKQPEKSGADALSRRARDMARNIQGNLGRCLYRRKDIAEMEEVSKTLMELANELDAALGGGVNPDGLPVGLTISEDGSLLNWRGENYVRQSTLGGGECELTLDGTDGCFGCSECLENIPPLANFCPNCGKAVKRMSKPLECPFCDEVRSYYEVDEWNRGYIACYSCGATGPKVKAARGANAKAKSLWRKAVKR